MAEERSQRPYRASEPPLRSHARTSNNDPLAELARLIGQTDPFGEFGRDTARRSAAPAERTDWNAASPSSPYAPRDEADWNASSAQRPDGNGYYNARGTIGEQTGRQPTTNPTKPTMRREVIHRVKRTIRTTRTNRIRTSSPKMSTTMKRRLRADAWELWRLPA